ncbi:MAG: flagellar assembly peptidoglycan hydrolase FlgJ [Marinobacter sp.]|uniref:flagellar assembly peptidoglycan hydrolase FlgJ n=1 Tax=Marinobacter sp. TaxID=50741 RepID=UPI001B487399|nr:flagellar assembly peptidoglycan hydrolase FlgJ [Marinobacter sp.]MBQ0748441.1 flagellar assembly peptidoglycan hydrolase FlgJ [Marinobacter sp.]MBQ0815825.1 flagellar assembly peptidoglycan hydrolase FlgJ [Marinobacter sp.]
MQDYQLQQARVYTDFSGLNALKNGAREDEQAALEEVARQFESIFLSEMLKSMRKAGDVFAEGNYLNSSQSEFYRDMFDSQMSLTMAGGQGTGLAEALVRQLGKDIPGANKEGAPLASHKTALADYDRSLPPISPRLPERIEAVSEVAAAESSTPAVEASALPEQFESPEHFVRTLLPVAESISADTGISPQLMVAQAALETGWGRHMIQGDGSQPSYNLFGIKADSRWQGDAVTITTTEFREGVPMKERADFRAYPDYESSFRDYVAFLESNPRYRDVLASADQPDVFARKLQEAGYATDPQYGDKINRIMNRDSLMTLSMDNGAGE